MSLRDKIEHAIQNQPCTVKELKQKFGGERGADRKVMEALDELVREAVVCQRQGVFFTVRSGRADKALLCKVVKLGKNFAFVMLEDGTSDIFIPGRFTKGDGSGKIPGMIGPPGILYLLILGPGFGIPLMETIPVVRQLLASILIGRIRVGEGDKFEL
jgi:hypothetical protein